MGALLVWPDAWLDGESKWYLANWGSTSDLRSTADALDDTLQIDYEQMESSLRRAQEVLSLRRELAYEQQRINELQEKSKQPKTLPRKSKKPRSLWDRLFN